MSPSNEVTLRIARIASDPLDVKLLGRVLEDDGIAQFDPPVTSRNPSAWAAIEHALLAGIYDVLARVSYGRWCTLNRLHRGDPQAELEESLREAEFWYAIQPAEPTPRWVIEWGNPPAGDAKDPWDYEIFLRYLEIFSSISRSKDTREEMPEAQAAAMYQHGDAKTLREFVKKILI